MVFSQKLVKRYQELKAEVPDCLLLMQVGAFMQVMAEDARLVAEVTGLKLQLAGEVDTPVVLGGFPISGLDAYVGKLARAGHSVAIALQDEQKERHLQEVIQKFQLGDRLPGHILVVQIGKWWELWGDIPEMLPIGWQRFPESRRSTVRNILWESGLAVAWIEETGRRVTALAERTLVCRWPGVMTPYPLSSPARVSP